MLFIVIARVGLFPGSGAGFGVCAGYAGRAPSSTRPSASSQRITAPLGLAAARARLGPTALFFLSYFCWSEARCASLYGSVAAAAARRARRDTLVLLVGLLTLGHYILTSEGQTLGL